MLAGVHAYQHLMVKPAAVLDENVTRPHALEPRHHVLKRRFPALQQKMNYEKKKNYNDRSLKLNSKDEESRTSSGGFVSP